MKAEIVAGAVVNSETSHIHIVNVLSVACEANGNDTMGRLNETSVAQLRAGIQAAYDARVETCVMTVATLDILTAWYLRRERAP